MLDITEPLILTVGSHAPGSGRGCAMQLVSWCDGDEQISDYPAGVNKSLARMVQSANDSIGGRYAAPTDEYAEVPARYAGRLLDIAFSIRNTQVDSPAVKGRLRECLDPGKVHLMETRFVDGLDYYPDDYLTALEQHIADYKRLAGLTPVTPPSAAAVDQALVKMSAVTIVDY